MQRRDFLRLSAFSAFVLLTPREVKAFDYPVYSGPFWVFIECKGGWDPTMLCNHQPDINELATAKIKKSAGNIDYVALSPKVENFFDAHHSDILVINGISAQTNAHNAGNVNFMSGHLESGYPTFGALLNKAYRLSSPIGHIQSGGGYKDTARISSTTVVKNGSIIESLTNYDKKYDGSLLYEQSALSKLELAKAQRIERLLSKHSSISVKESISLYKNAQESTARLEAIVPNLSLGIQSSNSKYQSEMYSSTHVAIAGYASDEMCLVVNARTNGAVGGMDTHADHDVQHALCIDGIVDGIENVIEDLKKMGVYDNTVIVVGSDMGRTPTYNSFAGKDHWPVTSMLLIGPRVAGDKTIGATTSMLENKKLDPDTLEISEDGITLTYADMHQLFRRYSGIENREDSLKYNLNANALNIDQFFRKI